MRPYGYGAENPLAKSQDNLDNYVEIAVGLYSCLFMCLCDAVIVCVCYASTWILAHISGSERMHAFRLSRRHARLAIDLIGQL